MERNRKERVVLSTVAELFDLPADVVAGLPRLEMVGSRQLYLEHHAGILAYSEEQIDVNTTAGALRVRGEGLCFAGHDRRRSCASAGGLRGGSGEVAAMAATN